MVEWLFDTLATFGIVEHNFPGADTPVYVGLPEHTCSRPVLRCADAILSHHTLRIIGSELRFEEQKEIVSVVTVQSL